jgi:hypothetical protein
MKKLKICLLLPVVLLLFSFGACKRDAAFHKSVFQLKEGNFWNYRGKFNEQAVELRMEVKQVKNHGKLTIAVIRGFLTDVMEGEDWEAKDWGLLVVGNEHYYKIAKKRADSIIRCLSDHGFIGAGMVTDADLFMEALYDTGQTFGEAAQLTRNDGNYFWRVVEKSAFEPTSIRGLKLMGPFNRYAITYKTVSDKITMDIVPEIGIVRYRYSHHGTPAELDMQLVEARLQ